MTPESIGAYFTPLDYFWYLLAIFVAMVVWYQFKWAKTCRTKVLVCIQKADGHGDYQLADQKGGSVSLKDPHSNTTRLWPINELATIGVPYPGVGFVPAFMQKEIRMVIVDEEDWEPLTNRGRRLQGVASIDVLQRLREISELPDLPDNVEKAIGNILRQTSAAPSREMIASPALLGNLIHEKVSEAINTVTRDTMEAITGITKRLNNMVSPTIFYICFGVMVVGIIFLIWQVMSTTSQISELKDQLESIQRALGIIP